MTDPRFTVTHDILNLSIEITRLLGRYDGLSGAKPQPQLRRKNRIRTIQGTLAIEGNTLELDQVTALLDGKRVLGSRKEVLEVQNANAVYDHAGHFAPYSIQSLLKAHGMLMHGILPDAGRWRTGAVGITKGSRVTHVAPKAQYVQGMVKDLLAFVKASKLSPLVTSSIFHHEFEFIHPFTDGNGRIGRLWQHILLVRYSPVFEYVPLESIVRERQDKYYETLERADRANDSTVFVEFMLSAILDGTQELLRSMRVEQITVNDRLQAAKERFQSSWFSRKDYQAFFIRISAPTASRDLKRGVEIRLLERHGEKALTKYRFK